LQQQLAVDFSISSSNVKATEFNEQISDVIAEYETQLRIDLARITRFSLDDVSFSG